MFQTWLIECGTENLLNYYHKCAYMNKFVIYIWIYPDINYEMVPTADIQFHKIMFTNP